MQAASIDQLDRLYFVTIAPLVVLLLMWIAHVFMPALLSMGAKFRPAPGSVLPVDQPAQLANGGDVGGAGVGEEAVAAETGQVDTKVEEAQEGHPEPGPAAVAPPRLGQPGQGACHV